MIAAPSPRAIAPRLANDRRVCPACRSTLDRAALRWTCSRCGRVFPEVAGIADLRLAPDRYLDLEDDRNKARRLAAIAPHTSFAGLVRAYYDLTDDVDARMARRYVAHLECAEERGEAFLPLLPDSGRVLEVGCGSGGMLAAAARRGIDIKGVDIASRWLIVAKQRLSRPSEPPKPRMKAWVPLVVLDQCANGADAHWSSTTSGTRDRPTGTPLSAANAEHLPWPDATFDAIFADSVLEHLDDVPKALREWRRVARRGASLILISPNRYSLLPDPHAGLWGVGWLPRRWQAGYVRRRRHCEWPVSPFSAREAARSAVDSGWTIRRIAAAPAPGRSLGSSLYDAARRFPFASGFLRRFGPLWLIDAVREDSP